MTSHPTLNSLLAAVPFLMSPLLVDVAMAQQTNLVVSPPQSFSNSCQSYSIAQALGFASDQYRAKTPQELRDLEQNVFAKLKAIADAKHVEVGSLPRTDWGKGVEQTTGGKYTVKTETFTDRDAAMRFIAQVTGISSPSTLGTSLSLALVKAPALVSFTRIGASNYAGGHIVAVFGVEAPLQSNGPQPKLLILNSAVQYAGGVKNACEATDFPGPQSPGDKRYSGLVSLTNDYALKFTSPYLVDRIVPE